MTPFAVLSIRRAGAAMAGAACLALAACGSGGNTGGGAAGDGTGGSGGDKGAATAAAGGAAAPGAIAPPAGKRWSEVVVRTPEGGHRMGNPDAPVKVIEFASHTCHVCRDFSEASAGKLEPEFIDTGRVSFEFRNYIRDGLDLTASAITQCAGPDRFFPLMHATFAGFDELIAGAQAGEAAAQATQTLPANQRLPALAKAYNVPTFFQARGMTAQAIDTCLADTPKIEAIAEGTSKANEQYRIEGTPTFIVNGQKVAVTQWDALAEELRKAVAR